MKLLKINEQHQGFFLKNGDWASIESIEKEDILYLIEATAVNEIEMDEPTEDLYINNPAAKTIYDQLLAVLKELNENRESYLADIDHEFDELERKYGIVRAAEGVAENE